MTFDLPHCLPYIFLLLQIGLVVSKQIDVEGDTIQQKYLARHPYLPTFLTPSENITASKGEEAILPCAVEHRGTRTVVWRLNANPNPITIGVQTYISDIRFKVKHPKHSLEWNLHIQNVQPEDSGIYVCSVSAVTRNIRQLMWLTVEDKPNHNKKQASSSQSSSSSSSSSSSPVPEITIKGDFFVERGDTLKLQCNAKGSQYHPDEIDWFKDGNKIKNSERVTLEKRVSYTDRTISSSLHIKRGHMKDAGTYVCRTSDLQVTSVRVNVLNTESNNEKRESMDSLSGSDNNQNGSGRLSDGDAWILLMTFFMTMLASQNIVL